MSFYRASVGLFIAASATAFSGGLTLAWTGGFIWTCLAISIGLGGLGLGASIAAHYFTKPEEEPWKALALCLVLAAASYVAIPIASAISSATYFWAHRAEADRIARLFPDRDWASTTWSGRRCDGLSETECNEIAEALRSFGASIVSGGNRGGTRKVRLYMRGDYNALHCPEASASDCYFSWSLPLGDHWHLVPF